MVSFHYAMAPSDYLFLYNFFSDTSLIEEKISEFQRIDPEGQHSMMSRNLNAKKSSTDSEYGVW